MQRSEIESRVGELVNLCEKAPLADRPTMRREVDRVIRSLKAQHHAVPGRLRRLKDRLEDEAYDDMFDNMPV